MKKMILVCLVILFFACGQETQSEVSVRDIPDQQLDSATVVFTIDGERNAVLWAETIYQFKNSNVMIAKNIKIEFDGDPPEGNGILVADSGTVSDGQKIIDVYGNVRLNTERGTKLTTESLKWDTFSDKVTTDDHVKIERGNEKIEGKGLETDAGFNRIIIKEQIRGELSG